MKIIFDKQSEKSVEAYLFQQMKSIGGMSSKWVCPSHNGKPDRICEFPNGLVVFVETKSEGEKPEPHQLREHERMRKERNQIVEVLDKKEKIDSFILKYRNLDKFLRDRNI